MRTVHAFATVVGTSLLTACGGGTPTSASPVVYTTAPAVSQTPLPSGRLHIVDGWTGAAVTTVRVWLGDEPQPVDADGTILVGRDGGCPPARFEAPGYLERRLSCLEDLMLRGRSVTLWPAATDEEAQAIREAVFLSGVLRRFESTEYGAVFHLDADLARSPEVAAAWSAANDRLAAASRQQLRAAFVPQAPGAGDDGFIIAAGDPPTCSHSWFTWNVAAAGFCWAQGPGYFVTRVELPARRAADRSVALRALLYSLGMWQHRMPGLLNATAPASDLSDFERRTLHMALQRTADTHRRITFPDTEQ